MCGIVGLHLRNPDLYPRLGEFQSRRRELDPTGRFVNAYLRDLFP